MAAPVAAGGNDPDMALSAGAPAIPGPPRLPQGAASRAQSFSTGTQGDDPGNAASSLSLNADADRFNAAVPRQIGLSSVLQTAMPSANGMSANDYQRVLPGGYMLPSQNGTSADTYEKAIYMHLQGQDEI